MQYYTLENLCKNNALANKRVFIRSDLNVPLDSQGNITDDTRIRASLQAIQMAHAAGATVMVTSHLGRPTEGQLQAADSLAPVAALLSRYLNQPVRLITQWVDGVEVQPQEIVLLENCRGNLGEKKNEENLAKKMARLCDVYVNDAFGTAHRAEATTHAIARFAPIACAGPLLDAELQALGKALHAPKRPLVAIVGGSKVSTKLDILTSLSEKVDQLIVGGGIANTFMLAAGLPIGESLAEPDLVPQAKKIIEAMAARGAAVPIPTDVVVAENFDPVAAQFNFSLATAVHKPAESVGATDRILDIGAHTAKTLATILQKAGTIVWNGPVGVFEHAPFAAGTEVVAQAIALSPAFSIAGGGDTIAAITQFQVTDQIDYISTGGGAFLEFLEGKTLPAVAILLEQYLKKESL